MKTALKFFAVLTLVSVAVAPSVLCAQDAPPAPPPPDAQGDQGAQGSPGDQGDQGDQGASFQTFYDQLGDQGTWVQTDNYGYVFQPNVTDPNWAPYTDGHWAYTDTGWAWVSDEPWGWATYHYGRWANIDGTGWVWVPGYQWAPAWVSWRYGGGYCGWAPLPPETFIGVEYGDPGFDAWSTFHFGGDVDVSFGIGPGCYNFINVGDMGYPNYHGRFLDRGRNFAIITRTTNITNININRGAIGRGATNFHGVAVGGPPINEINAHSKEHIQTVHLTAANQAGRSTLQGNSLSVYAPHFNPTTAKVARPAQVARTLAQPTFNRGVSINKPLDVTPSIKGVAPSAEAIQAAHTAALQAPAKARIATENTVQRTTLSRPLTSMETVKPTRQVQGAGGPAVNTFTPGAQHPAASSPYTGESVNPKPAVQRPEANSPYTGESGQSQAELAREKMLERQKLQQQQRTEALQNERDSEAVRQTPERTPVQPQQEERQVPQHTYAPQQQSPAPVVHTQQPVYHPPQPQEKPAPQQQPAAKKENQGGPGAPGGSGPNGSGNPYGH